MICAGRALRKKAQTGQNNTVFIAPRVARSGSCTPQSGGSAAGTIGFPLREAHPFSLPPHCFHSTQVKSPPIGLRPVPPFDFSIPCQSLLSPSCGVGANCFRGLPRHTFARCFLPGHDGKAQAERVKHGDQCLERWIAFRRERAVERLAADSVAAGNVARLAPDQLALSDSGPDFRVSDAEKAIPIWVDILVIACARLRGESKEKTDPRSFLVKFSIASGAPDLPPISQPLITGVSRF